MDKILAHKQYLKDKGQLGRGQVKFHKGEKMKRERYHRPYIMQLTSSVKLMDEHKQRLGAYKTFDACKEAISRITGARHLRFHDSVLFKGTKFCMLDYKQYKRLIDHFGRPDGA